MSETIQRPDPAGQDAILSALAKAMGQVQKIAKESRNKHDGYNFASIDDFLALVNPICAENGLIVHMQEAAREDFERQGRSGTSAWMRQSFDIKLYHVSGQSLPPVTRTVEVLRNGAQAYGSAQSYALKQFWRCTLLIPTGDKDDADYAPTDAGTITRHHETRRQSGPSPVEHAVAALTSAASLEALAAIWRDLPPGLRSLPEVTGAKDNRKAALALADDYIPHQGEPANA
jgi:hypothetical protein